MSRSSEYVSQWAIGQGSDCAVAGPLPASNGVIPTAVVAQVTLSCDDVTRLYKGVVFYGYEPVAWCCLGRDDVDAFKQWAATAFPAVQIVTVIVPDVIINCPPPNPKLTLSQQRDEMRSALSRLAPSWFVPATAVAPVQQVA
jgi:hypothetical protein